MTKLTDEQKAKCRQILDAFIESLNAYADHMASGDIPMQDGPTALRSFGAILNRHIIDHED